MKSTRPSDAMSFHPPVPAETDLVTWPADFGTRFSVFVDTEEEFDWRRPLSRENRSVDAIAALPLAGARFAGWGVPLTLMIDHPVATDLRAIEAIGPMLTRGTTVGTQLHPWVNPPFDEAVTPFNSFVGNLSRDLEAAKLDVLTRAIVEAFGEQPLAYRAGRYGIGPATLELLAERGYRLDSSIRSRFDYSGEGGPDFSKLGNHAWRVGGIVELPLTTVFTGAARGRGIGLYRAGARVPKGLGVLARAHVLSRVPLTPEGVPIGEAIQAVRIAVGEGVHILNFAFHSPSLVPGNTPFVRDESDLVTFWAWWDRMMVELDRLNVRPASLGELLAASA